MVTNYRVYIETTVIADWLLVETTPKTRRGKLSSQVKASHELVEFLLTRKNDDVLPFTSYWAIFEAIGVIKRTNIELWLVYDGVPASFYHELKDKEPYRLEDFQVKKIRALILKLTQGDKHSKAFNLLAEQSSVDHGIALILEKNLEAQDSFHVGVALRYGCEFFVAKDHHYYRRGMKALGNGKMRIMRPSAFVSLLRKRGLFNPSGSS